MIVVSQKEVRAALTYAKASELLDQGFRELATGQIESPTRHVFRANVPAPVLGFMPATNAQFLSAKVAAVSYANVDQNLDCHQGAVLLFDRSTAELKAVIDGTELTAIRTTAVSQVFLAALQNLDDDRDSQKPSKIAVIGSGVQAYHHIKMFQSCFGVEDFVVVSRSPSRVQDLQSALAGDHFPALIDYRTYGADLRDCDVIVTATHGEEIVLRREQVSSRAVIIAMGACQSKAQELATDLLDDCLFVVDHKPAALGGSGEGLYRDSILVKKPIFELIDLLTHKIPELIHANRPIVLKTVGLGFEDLVCAAYLYETLAYQGKTLHVKEFGGKRAY